MPRKELTIGENDGGQRLDKFLTKAFPNLPQAVLYKCIRQKDVKLNGARCRPESRLRAGDRLSLYWQEEFFRQAPREYDFLKAPAKLNIVYEDENILLLDKKPGLIVHPDENYHFDSLIARVQHYLYDKGEYRPQEENAFAPALVNRIDRNTSGIVMAAKNAEALRVLNQKVKDRELEKLYLCLARGRLEQKAGDLRGYLDDAAIEALKNGDEDMAYMRGQYDMRRRLIVDGLNQLGLRCFEPEGAFYVFPSVRSTGLTSEEFCEKLIYQKRVAVVPGSAFGASGEGFVRISYCYSTKHIVEALERMKAFLEEL